MKLLILLSFWEGVGGFIGFVILCGVFFFLIALFNHWLGKKTGYKQVPGSMLKNEVINAHWDKKTVDHLISIDSELIHIACELVKQKGYANTYTNILEYARKHVNHRIKELFLTDSDLNIRRSDCESIKELKRLAKLNELSENNLIIDSEYKRLIRFFKNELFRGY